LLGTARAGEGSKSVHKDTSRLEPDGLVFSARDQIEDLTDGVFILHKPDRVVH
jgi:hypothetical protein